MRYRVVVRVRPSLGSKAKSSSVVEVCGPGKVRVYRDGRNPLLLKFDQALGPDSIQPDVFEAVRDVVMAATDGQSGTILAYGQTGSGKTHTMIGDLWRTNNFANAEESECRGLVPRTLDQLFHVVATQRQGTWRICISFLEIYNEKVYDLLVEPRPGSAGVCAWDRQGRYAIDEGRLDVRENADGTMWVPGATMVEVCSCEQAQDVLRVGIASRTVGDNGVNPISSRSHAIFQIFLEKRVAHEMDDCLPQNTKLNLVDLAGSEKFQSDTSIPGPLLQELTCINHSLSTLGQCISALVERRSHIPCRNSKLTRLLQDSLKGSALTAMCICISPSASALEETLSSLRFADRAKRAVIERPPPTASSSGGGGRCQVASLVAQVRDLKDSLTRERHERIRLQQLLIVADSVIDVPSDRSLLQSRRASSLSPCGGSSAGVDSPRAASAPPKQRSVAPETTPSLAHISSLAARSPSRDDDLSSIRGSEEQGGSSASTSVGPSIKDKDKAEHADHFELAPVLQIEEDGHDCFYTEVPRHLDDTRLPTGCSDVCFGSSNVPDQCDDDDDDDPRRPCINAERNRRSSIASSGFETCISECGNTVSREHGHPLTRSRHWSAGEFLGSVDLLLPTQNEHDEFEQRDPLDRLRLASLDSRLSAADLRQLIKETLHGVAYAGHATTSAKLFSDLVSSSCAAEHSEEGHSDGEGLAFPGSSARRKAKPAIEPSHEQSMPVEALAERAHASQAQHSKMTDLRSGCQRQQALKQDPQIERCSRNMSKRASAIKLRDDADRCKGIHPIVEKDPNLKKNDACEMHHGFHRQDFLSPSQVSTLAREHDSTLPGGGSVLDTLILPSQQKPKPVRRWRKTSRNSDNVASSNIGLTGIADSHCSDIGRQFKSNVACLEGNVLALPNTISTGKQKTHYLTTNNRLMLHRAANQPQSKASTFQASPNMKSGVRPAQEDAHKSTSSWQSHQSSGSIEAAHTVYSDDRSGLSVAPSQRIPPGSQLGGATAARAGEQLRRQKELLRRGREDRARRRSEEREGVTTSSSAEKLQAIIFESRATRSSAGKDSVTDSSAERLPVSMPGSTVGRTRSPDVSEIASRCWGEFEGALGKTSPRCTP